MAPSGSHSIKLCSWSLCESFSNCELLGNYTTASCLSRLCNFVPGIQTCLACNICLWTTHKRITCPSFMFMVVFNYCVHLITNIGRVSIILNTCIKDKTPLFRSQQYHVVMIPLGWVGYQHASIHHTMHHTMHQPACPSTKTPINPTQPRGFRTTWYCCWMFPLFGCLVFKSPLYIETLLPFCNAEIGNGIFYRCNSYSSLHWIISC